MLSMVEAKHLRCPRCGHALAMWLTETEDWQPLGARIKKTRQDNRHNQMATSLVCPLCGGWKRIPDGPKREP